MGASSLVGRVRGIDTDDGRPGVELSVVVCERVEVARMVVMVGPTSAAAREKMLKSFVQMTVDLCAMASEEEKDGQADGLEVVTSSKSTWRLLRKIERAH